MSFSFRTEALLRDASLDTRDLQSQKKTERKQKAIQKRRRKAQQRDKDPKKKYPFRKRIKYEVIRFFRIAFIAFVLVLWLSLRKLFLHRFEFAFCVYGTLKDQDRYWYRFMKPFMPSVFPIGFMRFKGKWGLTLVTTCSAQEFETSPTEAQKYVSDIERHVPSLKSIALAGRLPSFLHRNGYVFDASVVSGQIGTAHAMRSALLKGASLKGKDPSELTVAILGYGFTGKTVANLVKDDFKWVYGIDPRVNEERVGNVITTQDSSVLMEVDITLVLTGKGDDIVTVIQYIQPGSLVIDDTHPAMQRKIRRSIRKRAALLVKAVVLHREYDMQPRLSGYMSQYIPGCLLECLVSLENSNIKMENFGEMMDDCGFYAEIPVHPDDY